MGGLLPLSQLLVESALTMHCCPFTQMMLWNMKFEWELHMGKTLPPPSCSDLFLSHGQKQVGHMCTASGQCQREGRNTGCAAAVDVCTVRTSGLLYYIMCVRVIAHVHTVDPNMVTII